MTAAERTAIRLLIDKATRAKLQAQARHGARLHAVGKHFTGTPANVVHASTMSSRRRGFMQPHDESYDLARAVNLGLLLAGATGDCLPSERIGRRKAA